MDVRAKLAVLADAAKYDASCASSGAPRKGEDGALGNSSGIGICHSYTPDGRCVSLLKILLTNFCIYDCKFCINRVTSDTPRARFTTDEVVWLTLEFYKRNYIEGLFLSSGIIQSPDYTMEQLGEVARSLRVEHRYNGYIHLKAIPGAAPELIHRAALHADRMSANVELPTDADLAALAPEKTMGVINSTMARIREQTQEKVAERRVLPAGQSTQMVIGATGTPDREILQTSTQLYRKHRLKRVYYSAYSPTHHADGALPAQSPPLVREHRLYQADWLIRHYGFAADELTLPGEPDLDLHLDPKMAWALRHREFFPVDVNFASREALLRVPGFGKRNVDRIVSSRRWRRLKLSDLRKLRVALNRARPFIVAGDHSPTRRLESISREAVVERMVAKRHTQLTLFADRELAITGEL